MKYRDVSLKTHTLFLTLTLSLGASHAQTSTNSVELDAVVLTAAAEEAPKIPNPAVSASTKLNTSLLETPQAVSIIGESTIEDRHVRRLEEALRTVAGVSTGGYYTDWDYYRIRGFDAAFTTFYDGIRGDGGQNVEIFGLEKIEVVKGPASTLYGQGPVGGMVNLVSKRPKPEYFADTQMTVGSFNLYEPAVDMGAPLNDDQTVYARLIGLYRTSDSYVDFASKERVHIAPSLTWEIGPDTTLTFLTKYEQDWDILDFPLPAAGTVLPNPNGPIPISRFVGEPDNTSAEQRRFEGGYELRHRFNDRLSLRQNFRASNVSSDYVNSLYPSALRADQRTLERYPYSSKGSLDRIGVDTALEAEFDTGSVEHNLVGGVDFFKFSEVYDTKQIDYTDYPGSYPPLDLYNPVYGAPLPAYASFPSYETRVKQTGLYVLDQAALTEQLTFTAGARFDYSTSKSTGVPFSESAITPRTGLSYEFKPGIVTYANYSHSFNPQWSSTDAAGNPVEPERGINYEIGLKTELLDGRLRTLLALYHLKRKNVATPNLATVNPLDAIATGKQRSQGIELEGSFDITEGWEITGAYTYTDAVIAEDNNLPVGARLYGVPRHTISLWSKYTLQHGPLKGLGVGLGGRHYSDQEGDVTYTAPFRLPSYTIMDAAVYYERGRFNAQVNVNNLLDKRHFVGAYNNLYVRPGEPLNVTATVGWTF